MQSEIPSLPIVCTDGHSRSPSKETKSTLTEQRSHPTCKNAVLMLPSGKLRSMFASPYKNSTRICQTFEPAKASGKNVVCQRISSAKMLRIKQLQNQLADAHYHLNELANENRLLKVVQKRQDSALRQYEGTNAQLPKIINSHQEELRVLGAKYKKLKAQYRETCEVLKEKDKELQSLQANNKKLLQLSKDRHLGEREKLQMQVFDLNHRISQQDETIQTLKRKLSLESKYLKHQLNIEMQRHKETQKALQETLRKLRDSELLLDNREKRLIHSSNHPLVVNKNKNVKSLSLTNLVDRSTTNVNKPGILIKRKSDSQKSPQALPMLSSAESSNSEQLHVSSAAKTETMASLQNLRRFRLSKVPFKGNGSSAPNEKLRHDMQRGAGDRLTSTEGDSRVRPEVLDKNGKVRSTYELPNDIKKEFGYSSSGDESVREKNFDIKDETHITTLTRSREVYARVSSSPIDRIPLMQAFEEKLMKTGREQITTKQEKTVNVQKSESENLKQAKQEFKSKRDLDSDEGATCEESFSDVEACQTTPNSETEGTLIDNAANFVTSTKSSVEKHDETVIPTESPIVDSSNTSITGLSTLNKSSISFINNSSNSPNVFIEQRKSLTFKELMAPDPAEVKESTVTWNEKKSQVLKDFMQKDKNRINDSTNMQIESNVTPHVSLHEEKLDSTNQELITPNVENDKKKIGKTSRRNSKSSIIGEIDMQRETVTKTSKVTNGMPSRLSTVVNETSSIQSQNPISFNKEKLLAAMKAIDDNENIEVIEQKQYKNSEADRSRITENLYRGIPTQSRRKSDASQDAIPDGKSNNGHAKAGCSKLH